MAAYTEKQYRFIVEQLAEGEAPEALAFAFAKRWKDTACTPEDVAACARPNLNDEWGAYFDAWRAAFLAGAPTKDPEFRIALLDKWARNEAARGSYRTAAKYLELIAKEQAGFYGGKGGSGATEPKTAGPITITRTIIDSNESQHSDAAGVPPVASTESV